MTYARPTPSALEAAVERLIEPIRSSSSDKPIEWCLIFGSSTYASRF